MIKDQCDSCRKQGTENCNQQVVFDGCSCEEYSRHIDLEKHGDSSNIPSNEIVDNETPALEEETLITADYLKENTSISGWLSFFLFSIFVGGLISAVVPLAQYQSTLEEYGSAYLVWCDLSLGIMLFALAIYTLVSFCNRKPDAVFLAKTYVCVAFATNFIVLLGGDYDESGLGSFPRIVRSLIWGVIWFIYLCRSNKVEEVIPSEYRKHTAKDYYIIAALVLIPVLFMALGIGNLFASNKENEQTFIENTTLAKDEYTDGRVVFKCPVYFTCDKQEVGEPKITLFQLNNDTIADITVCSDYDADKSRDNFNSYWENWEDENAKQYNSSVIVNDNRSINEHPYFYKVTKYEVNGNTVYWRYAMLFDNASGKVCVVSAYDGGYDYYIQEILESIRFQ